MKLAYGLAAALAAGFCAAWYIQGLRWDSDIKSREAISAESIAVNVNTINQHLVEARRQAEEIRASLVEYRKGAEREISDLERRVTAGPERLYIEAKCPAVPATGADASRADSGTAELDATATGYYFALERGLAEQYGLLQFCRAELKKRSAP